MGGLNLLRMDPSIVTNYNPQNGLLTLSGISSVENYNTLIRSLVYFNHDLNPIGDSREVMGQCWDSDDLPSNFDTILIELSSTNNPPVLSPSNPNPITYTEDDPAVLLVPSMTVMDPDDELLEVCFAVLDSPHSYELLQVDRHGLPLVVNYDAQRGVLQLSGPQRVEVFQQALQTLSYINSNENFPDLTQEVNIWCEDPHGETSNVPSIQISLIPENDPPVIDLHPPSSSGSGSGPSGSLDGCIEVDFVQGDDPVVISDHVTIEDVDSTELSNCRVTILNPDSSDVLGTEIASNSPVTATYNAGELILNGPATLNEFECILNNVYFSNPATNPLDGMRQIQYVCTDTSGGQSNTQIAYVNVHNLVEVPIVDLSGPNQLGDDWIDTLEATSPSIPIAHPTSVITDSDSTQLDYCAIKLPGKVHQGEGFTLIDRDLISDSIDWNWHQGSGTLHVNGPATLSEFTNFLHGVYYTRIAPLPYSSVDISVQCVDIDGNIGPLSTTTLYVNCLPACEPDYDSVLVIEHHCDDCL